MNALVVRALAHALDTLLAGATVRKAGAISERELALHLTGLPPAVRPSPAMLILSVEPGTPHVRLGAPSPLRRRLTEQLGEAPGLLAGSRVIAVRAVGLERVLALELDPRAGAPLRLFFELLPRTPFLVVTREGGVVTAMRAPGTRRADDRRMARDAIYELPFGMGPPAKAASAPELLAAWLAGTAPTEDAWAATLAEHFPAVDQQFLRRLLSGATTIDEAIRRLDGCRGPIVLDPGPPPALQPDVAGERDNPGGDSAPVQAALATLDAVARYADLGRAGRESTDLRQAVLRSLKTESARIERLLAGLERDRTQLGDAAVLRRQGETLLAHLVEVPRGARTVTLADPYAGPPIEIPLDPKRTPAANAEAMFSAARRVDRAAARLATRRTELAARVVELSAAAEEIAGATADELQGVGERLAALGLVPAALVAPLAAGVEKRRQAAAPRLPYRRYALAGGWEIWVGRSAADNDILTHELARPHDLWLHAHGASGSHVLLRRDAARGDAPPAAAVQAAAAVAAYFSAARHSRMVPVIVTEKRYVRKPRRSPPGTAVCLREKTVMAAPAAPASGEREDA
jgi:predicted ribosome quality control (RQC) complex YloA/Tae2 family protein